MKLEKVYDGGGECLGNEYINISELQRDTKRAIAQIIYLDEVERLIDSHIVGVNKKVLND